MKIITPSDAEGTGKPGATFTGQFYPYTTVRDEGVAINNVNFTPGARTYWHHHEAGQILVVLAGRGLVQVEGDDVHSIRMGDTVWSPPGEMHWHGASPDSYVVHTAISLGTTVWGGEVAESDYTSPPVD